MSPNPMYSKNTANPPDLIETYLMHDSYILNNRSNNKTAIRIKQQFNSSKNCSSQSRSTLIIIIIIF